jgi:hypothetical protein
MYARARRCRQASAAPLHNFDDTEIPRLWVPDAGIFVVFGRVVISNADGDPQNATARLATFDGATELVPFRNRFRLFVPPIRRIFRLQFASSLTIARATFSQYLVRIPALTLINPSANLEAKYLEQQDIFRL